MTATQPTDAKVDAARIAARLERVLREARKDEEQLKRILETRRLKRRLRLLNAPAK